MDRIIRELKEKAKAFCPCKDEAIAADHVVCGKSCDLKGALGFYTPSAWDQTVQGCSRGKIYKRTSPNEFVTRYYFDADDRLIAISNKEHVDQQRTVIDYEDDVIYAFEWTLSDDQEKLSCVTVCGYDSGRVRSCLTLETTVNTITFVNHEFFEYDAEGVVSKVKTYTYYLRHDEQESQGKTVLFPEDWDFKTPSDKLYAGVKPYIEHQFTQSEAEELMPFLTKKLGSAKVAPPQKKALSLSSQKPLYNRLAKDVSKDMSLDELILAFRKMLDPASRKDELLLFELISEDIEDKPMCFFRLVRQIPDGAGEFIQMELRIDFESSEKYPLESEWFQASGEEDTTYLDEFVDYIRKTSAYQALRERKVFDVKASLDRT